MTNKPIAIIGAGNGGQTTAAWLRKTESSVTTPAMIHT